MDQQAFQHQSLELMSEMARALGYKKLQQTDIDKFYVPDQHAKEAVRGFRLQNQMLRVLRQSKTFSTDRDEQEVLSELQREQKEDGG